MGELVKTLYYSHSVFLLSTNSVNTSGKFCTNEYLYKNCTADRELRLYIACSLMVAHIFCFNLNNLLWGLVENRFINRFIKRWDNLKSFRKRVTLIYFMSACIFKSNGFLLNKISDKQKLQQLLAYYYYCQWQ
jgi:hypothetical protein